MLQIIGAFLCGSIPVGFLVGKLQGVDLRLHGSGNIGTTNAQRVLGSRSGLITLCGDLLKGLIAVSIFGVARGGAPEAAAEHAAFAALAAVLGHCYSPFLHFRGGKGVATGFGSFLGVAPLAAVGAAAIFAVTIKLSRYVSLGSILAALVLPLLYGQLVPVRTAASTAAVVLTAAVILIRHKSNIARLWQGTERKLEMRRSPG